MDKRLEVEEEEWREKEGFTLGRRDRYFRYYKIAKKKKGFEEKD